MIVFKDVIKTYKSAKLNDFRLNYIINIMSRYNEVTFYPSISSRVTVTQSSVFKMLSRWIIIDRETLLWFIPMVVIIIMCWILIKFPDIDASDMNNFSIFLSITL